MSGVKDGTCRDLSVVCKTRGFAVLLCSAVCVALMAMAGCQTAPTFRGQSPAFDDRPPSAAPKGASRRIRRVDEEPLPDEEMVPDGSAEGLPLSNDSAEQLNDPIIDIVIEGNETIETSAIRKLVHSPVGRPPAEQQIREDVRALYSTRWFFSVEPRYRRNDAGLVLVFRVIERPMVEKVEYRGNDRIKPYSQDIRHVLADFSLVRMMGVMKASAKALRNSDYAPPEIKRELLREILNSWHVSSNVLLVLLPLLADPDAGPKKS